MTPDVQEIIEQVRQHPRLIIAEDFEISVQRTASHSRKYHNGAPALETRKGSYWISLRVSHRRQPGRATTHFRTREALSALVDAAFESASRSSVDLWFRFPLWRQPRKAASQELGPVVSESSVSYEPLYPNLLQFPDSLDETYEVCDIETQLYRKGERFQLNHARQVHALQYSLLNHADERFYWLREGRALSRELHEREDWLDDLMRRSHGLAHGRPFSVSCQAPILIAPAAGAALLKRIASWFYADAVQNGRSPFSSLSRPCPLFSRAITLNDTGTYPDAPYSAPFDLEGSLTQNTVLVKEGELRDFLYDTYSATRENRLSTGNFTRQLDAESPSIGVTALYIEPSSNPPAKLLAELGNGFLLESIDSMEPVPESQTEWLVRGPGWRITRGGRAEALLEIPLRVDLMTLFQRVIATGSDLSFYGDCGAPSLLVESLFLGD